MISKDKEHELQDLQSIKDLSTAFAELSAIRMHSIQRQLQQNATFYEGIQEMYKNIKAKQQEKSNPLGISGKIVSVALTSNGHFYGGQNDDLVKSFLEGIHTYSTEAIMIGRSGQEILEGTGNTKNIGMITFKSEYPTTKEIYDFLDRVKPFQKVFLYYPKFVNMMTQSPTIADIAYNPDPTNEKPEMYIFEPELTKIVEFFETHVRFILFRRSLLEIAVARNAARLVAMMEAEEKAIKTLQIRKNIIKQAEKGLITERLLETIRAKPWINKQ